MATAPRGIATGLRLGLALTCLPVLIGAQSPLRSGPMAAWVTPDEACVWVQTQRPATVQIRYWLIGESRREPPDGPSAGTAERSPSEPPVAPESIRLTAPLTTSPATDGIAAPVLGPLEPGRRYAYELLLDDAPVPRPWPLVVTTPARPRPAGDDDDPPDIRFVIGSCAYVNDPPRDPEGPPVGAEYRVFDAIAALRPDFMLWLGDNTYYRADEWRDEAAMRRRQAHTRELPELQRLLAATHHHALWDDHDYGPDNSDRGFPLAAESRQVFRDYWPDREHGQDGRGLQRCLQYGDVELFLLDVRSFRTPVDLSPGEEPVMLGQQQLAWLQDGLARSTASVKFVAGGSQLIAPLAPYEGWADFPVEQQTLLTFLVERRIDGVVFLSGDRHFTELLRVERPGHHPWYELTSSPLTAGPFRNPRDESPARVPGTLVTERGFGLVSVLGPREARSVVLSAHDVAGEELWRQEIEADELRLP